MPHAFILKWPRDPLTAIRQVFRVAHFAEECQHHVPHSTVPDKQYCFTVEGAEDGAGVELRVVAMVSIEVPSTSTRIEMVVFRHDSGILAPMRRSFRTPLREYAGHEQLKENDAPNQGRRNSRHLESLLHAGIEATYLFSNVSSVLTPEKCMRHLEKSDQISRKKNSLQYATHLANQTKPERSKHHRGSGNDDSEQDNITSVRPSFTDAFASGTTLLVQIGPLSVLPGHTS